MDSRSFLARLFTRSTTKEAPFRRPVLDCKSGLTNDNWELSQVELNGLMIKYNDLIDSYGDLFVLLSFITLFAAAFPFGPLVAIFTNILENKYSNNIKARI